MKASHEMIFLYHIPDDEAGKKLKGVCFRMGIRVREITPDQFHHPLGYLAGLPGFEATEGSGDGRTFSEAMLVMKQFTSKRMDELFRQWKKAGVPRIPLKAVVTPQNAQWDSVTLYEELVREHQAMMDGKAAHSSKEKEETTSGNESRL